MENEQKNRIGQDFSLWGLLRYSLPSIAMNVFTQIFKSLDDGLFVSRYAGKTALAGINILNPLQFFQFSLNNLFAIGAANISSRKMGQGKQLEAKQIFSRIVIAAAVIGSIVALLINVFSGQLLDFLGADETLAPYAMISIRSVFLIIPISLINNIFTSYYPTAGKPSMGLYCSILNGAINVILDIWLVAMKGLGVLGACISTVAGEMAVFVVGLIFFTNRKAEIYFVRPQGQIVPTALEACHNGLPQFLNCISLSFTTLLINYQLLNYIGSDGIAANAIIGDLRRILTAAFFGYIICIGPIISYNYGSGNKEQLRKNMTSNNKIWFFGSILITILGLLCRHPMISIFLNPNENSEVFYDMTYMGLTYEFSGVMFFAGSVILSRLLSAVNLQRASSIHAIIRNLILRALCILVLPKLLGTTGIWLASPACEFFSFLIGFAIFLKHRANFGFTPKQRNSRPEI